MHNIAEYILAYASPKFTLCLSDLPQNVYQGNAG